MSQDETVSRNLSDSDEEEFMERGFEMAYGPAFPGGYLNREDYDAYLARREFQAKRQKVEHLLQKLGKLYDTIFVENKDPRMIDNFPRDLQMLYNEYSQIDPVA